MDTNNPGRKHTMEIKLSNKQAATLGQLFGEAVLFASPDNMRPTLAGVYFVEQAGKLRMVATDSYALAVFTTTATEVPKGFRTLIVASELAEVGKAMAKLKPAYSSDDQPKVTLTFGERELIAETDAWTLKAHVVEGDFPNYEQLIPAGDGTADAGWPAFNTAYLAIFAKVQCAKDGTAKRNKNMASLQLTCFGALKPARLESHSEHANFLGLLAPVRVS